MNFLYVLPKLFILSELIHFIIGDSPNKTLLNRLDKLIFHAFLNALNVHQILPVHLIQSDRSVENTKHISHFYYNYINTAI